MENLLRFVGRVCSLRALRKGGLLPMNAAYIFYILTVD